MERQKDGEKERTNNIIINVFILSENMTEAEYEKILSMEIKSEIMRKIDNEADRDKM